jgi:hypothetical protein
VAATGALPPALLDLEVGSDHLVTIREAITKLTHGG